MKIHLLQPPRLPGFISGGYRYNEELAERLVRADLGSLREVAFEDLAGDRAAAWTQAAAPLDLFVFDSLYLGHWPLPEGLVRSGMQARTRLLLHCLPSAAPGLSPEARARCLETEAGWIAWVGGVLSTGEGLAELVRARHGRSVQVARPGVAECFRPLGSGPEHESPFTVVCVGSLLPAKGQLAVLRGLGACLRNEAGSARIRCVLIGEDRLDSAYVDSLRAEAARAPGLELLIRGCIEQEDVARELRAAHLFVSGSNFESYGMAVVEALAAGCPTLVHDVGEARRWVIDGVNGYLIPARDETRFRAALQRCLTEPGVLGRMRGKASEIRPPSWELTFQRFVEACQTPEVADTQAPLDRSDPGSTSAISGTS